MITNTIFECEVTIGQTLNASFNVSYGDITIKTGCKISYPDLGRILDQFLRGDTLYLPLSICGFSLKKWNGNFYIMTRPSCEQPLTEIKIPYSICEAQLTKLYDAIELWYKR